MRQTYLILGATSGIAKAIARALARHGHDLILAGRSAEEVALSAADLEARFQIRARPLEFDATRADHVLGVLAAARECNDGDLPEGVVLAYGVMFPQSESEANLECLAQTIEVNFGSAARVLQAFGSAFAQRGSGVIVGISSVAGDRGRGSNYHYGASKAALTVFLDGMRHRLRASGVHVCTVLPGFVATPMTYGIVDPASPLCAQPEQVARDVLKAIDRKRGRVYTIWWWRWIMTVIRHLPEAVFLRTNL
jgi:short-subunit dehydrogenase